MFKIKYFILIAIFSLSKQKINAVIGTNISEALLTIGPETREFRHRCIKILEKLMKIYNDQDILLQNYLNKVSELITILDVQIIKTGISKGQVTNSSYEKIAADVFKNREKYIKEFIAQKEEHTNNIAKYISGNGPSIKDNLKRAVSSSLRSTSNMSKNPLKILK